MSWAIVEVNLSGITADVKVIGPFDDQHSAEMARRDRHVGRVLESDSLAWNTRSWTREVVSP